MAPKIVVVRKTCGHKLRTVKRETISPPSPGLLPSGSTRAIDLVGENSKSHRAHRTRQFCFFVLPSTRSAQITRNHSTHSCRPIQTEQVGGQVRACKLPSAPMQTRERSVRVLAPGAPGKRGLFHYWPPTWTLWSTCRRIRRTNSAPSLPMRPHVPTGGGMHLGCPQSKFGAPPPQRTPWLYANLKLAHNSDLPPLVTRPIAGSSQRPSPPPHPQWTPHMGASAGWVPPKIN